MNDERVKQEAGTIREILQNINKPKRLQSKAKTWSSSCLVRKWHTQNPLLLTSDALIQVFTNILETIEGQPSQQSKEFADILRSHYWDGMSMRELHKEGKPRAVEERALFGLLREAVEYFTAILLEREQQCFIEESQTEEERKGTESKDGSIKPDLLDTIGFIFRLKADDVEEIRKEGSAGPEPRWPGLMLALMGKVSQKWTTTDFLFVVLWVIMLLLTWYFAYPPLQWLLLDPLATKITALTYIGSALILPHLVGVLVVTNNDTFWSVQEVTSKASLRLFTHLGASFGFHIGYFFIFLATLSLHHFGVASLPTFVEISLCIIPLILAYAAARWVPYNQLRAFGDVRFTQQDLPLYIAAFAFGPLIGGFYWYMLSYLLLPFVGPMLFLLAFAILASIILWQRKKGNDVLPPYIWAGVGGIVLTAYTMLHTTTWLLPTVMGGLTITVVRILYQKRIHFTILGVIGLLIALLLLLWILSFHLLAGQITTILFTVIWIIFGRKYIWYPLYFWLIVGLSALSMYLLSRMLLTDLQSTAMYVIGFIILLGLDILLVKRSRQNSNTK